MKILKITGLLIYPTIIWVSITAAGFGPQSLSNLIELVFVLIGSIVITVIPSDILSAQNKFIISTALVIILRALMPVIPE